MTVDIDQVREELARGEGSLAGLADATDRAIRETLGAIEPPHEARYALLATGGYGRREMAVGSDVDLLFLTDDREGLTDFVEACLHAFWDLGLKLGYATRTIDDTLQLALDDHRTAMSLLDLRLIAGDGKLATDLVERLNEALFQPRRAELLRAIDEERLERHRRHGDTVYLLEPDIKSGEGGLRDIQGARWAARLVLGEVDLSKAGITEREHDELMEALDTLCRFRNALHGVAGRRTERVYFAHQPALAERLGDPDVSSCMQRYWRAARRVRALTRRILDVLRVEAGGSLGPQVEADGPVEPETVMRLFRRSSETRLPLHPLALEAAAATVPRFNDVVRALPEVAEDFFHLLLDPDDRGLPLRDLHDVGLLGAYIPELRCITGLYQHNVFHVYTVDVHTLHGIVELKRLVAAARDGEDGPLPAAMAELSQHERRILFLSLLMHDINKGGSPPVRAYEVAVRLGLGHEAAATVEGLVREHLLLALLAQTRDIHDETTQRHLAREVGDERALIMLFLLTHADMSSANPDLLTDWKASLLAELYQQTRQRLAGGLDVFADARRVVRERRSEVLVRLLGAEPEVPTARTRRVDRFFNRLPTRYVVVTPAESVVEHMDMAAERHRTGQPAVSLRSGDDGTAQITVVCGDQPGLLARLSGSLAAHGVDIIGADAFSMTGGTVIDVFTVEAPVPWDALRPALVAVARGDASPEDRLRSLERPSPLGERPSPPVPTEVSADNQASRRFTVIDVVGRDRPGLLFRVARAFHDLGLDVGLARITTEGQMARDAFYVEIVGGGKLDGPRLERVLERVREAVDTRL